MILSLPVAKREEDPWMPPWKFWLMAALGWLPLCWVILTHLAQRRARV